MAEKIEKEDIILKIKNLRRVYKDDDGADVEALEDVSLEVKRGEFMAHGLTPPDLPQQQRGFQMNTRRSQRSFTAALRCR